MRIALLLAAGGFVLGPFTARADDAGLSPEVQLCLLHLRDGERAALQKALGPLDELPLYRVQLDVDPAGRKVTGRAQILKVAQGRPLEALYLRVTPNAQGKRVKVSNATLNGQAAVLEHPEPSLYRVKLDPAVPPGAAALVEVRLEATVPEASPESLTLMGGMSQTSGPRDYGAFSSSAEAMLLTGILPQLPPLDAKGEPWEGPSGLGDLALYEPSHILASITVPAGWQALTTGAALGEVPEKGGKVRFSYAASGVRDFPLVVGKGYEKKTSTVNGVEFESWYAPGDADAASRVLGYASSSLGELEKRLGPTPWKVLRVVEAPLSGGAGGMEFSGLVVISTALYRAGGGSGPGAGVPGMGGMAGMFGGAGMGGLDLGQMMEETLEFTVAHEVGHQYFSELVGSDPVTEPVVDESLAQYSALLYTEWRRGKDAIKATRMQQLVMPWQFFRLGGRSDSAAARPTSEFADSAEYGAIVYGKAPLFYGKARALVGDAVFFKALRAYVDQYRYRWSCKTCFTGVLSKHAPDKAVKLEALRARWWDEAHGDEDLGQPDLGRMVEQLTGQQLDPATLELLRQLLPH